MQKVKLIKSTHFVWSCPNCDHFNEEPEPHQEMIFVRCEACHKVYKPEKEE